MAVQHRENTTSLTPKPNNKQQQLARADQVSVLLVLCDVPTQGMVLKVMMKQRMRIHGREREVWNLAGRSLITDAMHEINGS